MAWGRGIFNTSGRRVYQLSTENPHFWPLFVHFNSEFWPLEPVVPEAMNSRRFQAATNQPDSNLRNWAGLMI
jgi:hypothetical protein